jgi:multiple sugar transport system permease protein
LTTVLPAVQWSGLALVAWSVALAYQARARQAALAAALGWLCAVAPAVAGGAEAARPWRLGLLLPVLPAPGLLTAATLVGLAAALAIAWARQRSPDGARRRNCAIGWAVASAASAWTWMASGQRATLLQGAVEFGPTETLAAVAASAAAAVLAAWLARSPARRRRARTASLHLALATGCAAFGLPLYWLVLTSLRSTGESTSSDVLRLQPRVVETHAYRDPERPLVETEFDGEPVLARVVRVSGGRAELEVERPFRLRGFLFEGPAGLPERDRQADVFLLPDGGKGYVLRDLEQGDVLVRRLGQSGSVRLPRSELRPSYRFGFRWQNYTETLEWLPKETRNGLVYLVNSVWLAVMNVVGTLVSCAMAGFAFSRMRFPGRNGLFGLLLASMMLPAAVTILPRFLLWRAVGAVDTLVPLWLPSFFASAFYVFLLRQFYQTLPAELEDAAKIDGCGYWRTCWQVMTPQVAPALVVIGLWTFFGSWNDFMGPLTYVSTPEKMPVAYAVQLFRSDRGGEIGPMMAFAAMATLPLLIVFLFAQRRLVEGVQLSGLGGR